MLKTTLGLLDEGSYQKLERLLISSEAELVQSTDKEDIERLWATLLKHLWKGSTKDTKQVAHIIDTLLEMRVRYGGESSLASFPYSRTQIVALDIPRMVQSDDKDLSETGRRIQLGLAGWRHSDAALGSNDVDAELIWFARAQIREDLNRLEASVTREEKLLGDDKQLLSRTEEAGLMIQDSLERMAPQLVSLNSMLTRVSQRQSTIDQQRISVRDNLVRVVSIGDTQTRLSETLMSKMNELKESSEKLQQQQDEMARQLTEAQDMYLEAERTVKEVLERNSAKAFQDIIDSTAQEQTELLYEIKDKSDALQRTYDEHLARLVDKYNELDRKLTVAVSDNSKLVALESRVKVLEATLGDVSPIIENNFVVKNGLAEYSSRMDSMRAKIENNEDKILRLLSQHEENERKLKQLEDILQTDS